MTLNEFCAVVYFVVFVVVFVDSRCFMADFRILESLSADEFSHNGSRGYNLDVISGWSRYISQELQQSCSLRISRRIWSNLP